MFLPAILFTLAVSAVPPPGTGFDPHHHVGGEGPSFSQVDIPVQARLRRLAAVQVASWAGLKDAIKNIASGSSGAVTLATGFNCDYNGQLNGATSRGQITVAGHVTVHGYGAVCDAALGGPFFQVNSGAQLALDAMTLKNGLHYSVSQMSSSH